MLHAAKLKHPGAEGSTNTQDAAYVAPEINVRASSVRHRNPIKQLPLTLPILLAAAYLIAVIPMLASMIYAEITLQQLTGSTQAVLREGIATSEIGVALRSEITDLERAILQYRALKAKKLMPVINTRWSQINASISQLQNLQWNKALRRQENMLQRQFDDAQKIWKSNNKPAFPVHGTKLIDTLVSLGNVTDSIVWSSRQQVSNQVSELKRTTDRARLQIILSAVCLLPLGALLTWGVLKSVTSPLRQLVHAIAVLRSGNYVGRIAIGYPAEFRRVGQHLEWLRRRLLRLEADKDRFLRHVSHELKTPLASLRGGTELLGDGGLGELGSSQMEVVQIMDEASRELETLIENLLTYAEWRAKRHFDPEEWFNTRALAEEVLAKHRLLMVKKNLNLQIHLEATQLFGRRNQLRVVLDNLLTNAIKHAPVGSDIEVAIKDYDQQFEICVRDHGKGVPDMQKNAIFEPFNRGSESEELGIRGTGVGLAIVLETLQAHGGSVKVEDAHPGARFRLVWPRPSAPIDHD